MTKSMTSDTVGQKFMRAWQTKNSLLLIPIVILSVAVPIGAGLFAQSLGVASNLVAPVVLMTVYAMTIGGLRLNNTRADRELNAEFARIRA
jgi:hypothetical protein